MAFARPLPSSPPDGAAFAPTPEAIARIPRALAFRHDVLPLTVVDGVLSVALPDPADAQTLDAVRAAARLQLRALPLARDAIRAKLRLAYGDAAATAERARSDDAPAVVAVDLMLARAIAAHASDVHVEPDREGGRVRMRVDGILREAEPVPAELFARCVARIKILAGMDVADHRQPQDGRYAIPYENRWIDARVASVPTIFGEKLVIRLLDQFAAPPRLAALGMPADILERYRAAASAPHGFLVIAGPTGSGKTTTLYASLAQLDVTARNVCSVEDPAEIRLAGVAQVQVNARAGLTFASVLRAFMRQDPDVVMVGELRDAETAAVALSAALAGRMLFTTLHANDAPRTIDRLVELGVARHALAGALSAAVAQRLVRRLCETCRARAPIPAALARALRAEQEHWYVARGCRACDGSGYLGRTGVYELLVADDRIRDAIASGSSSVHIARLAEQSGYRRMREDGRAKVLAGITSFEELDRVAGPDAP